jgi:hypothetical protein
MRSRADPDTDGDRFNLFAIEEVSFDHIAGQQTR